MLLAVVTIFLLSNTVNAEILWNETTQRYYSTDGTDGVLAVNGTVFEEDGYVVGLRSNAKYFESEKKIDYTVRNPFIDDGLIIVVGTNKNKKGVLKFDDTLLGDGVVYETAIDVNGNEVPTLKIETPEGELITPLEGDFTSKGVAFYVDGLEIEEFKIGLFDYPNSTKLTDLRFTNATPFNNNGKAIARKIKGDVVLIDDSGNELLNISKKYSGISDDFAITDDRIALNFKYKKSIIIDFEGNTISKTGFNLIKPLSDSYFLATKKNSTSKTILDSNGQVVLTEDYSEITNIYENVFYASKGNVWYRVTIE